jgi:large subunit ribosomal protein L13
MATNKTFSAKAGETNQQWYVVDAEGKTLGRLATAVAKIIIGKHKPIYTPHVDTGDMVVVTNAAKVRVTGNRLTDKKYYRRSLYAGGGIKEKNLRDVLADQPERAIREAVWGMIPHGRLGRKMINKLKVYGGSDHPHKANNPKEMSI